VLCEGALAADGGARDGGSGVAVGEFFGEPGGFFAAMGVAEEAVDVYEARAGNDALVADMAETGRQVTKQVDFQFVAGSEVTVAAYGGEDVVAVAVPVEAGFSQAGSGGDHCLIAD